MAKTKNKPMEHISQHLRMPPDLPERRDTANKSKQRYKDATPSLKVLTYIEFRKLRICCPYCFALDDECDTCFGAGVVCPICTGARYLARHRPNKGSKLMACLACGYDTSSGWEYDPARELSSIENWVTEWQAGLVVDEELTKRKEIEAIRKETEARPRKSGWRYG